MGREITTKVQPWEDVIYVKQTVYLNRQLTREEKQKLVHESLGVVFDGPGIEDVYSITTEVE